MEYGLPLCSLEFMEMWEQCCFQQEEPKPNAGCRDNSTNLEFMYCVSSPRGPTRSIIKRVRWERPLEGWCKLNTDGAASGNPGLAGCGGIVRDEHSGCLSEYPL